MEASSTSYSQPYEGSLWVSNVDGTFSSWDGIVLSAYYHPSRKHTVTTVGKLGTKKSVEEAGRWAISYQTRGLWGNKAYYDTL